MVLASQLVGKVSIEGADQSQKVLLGMDAANKKAQDSLNTLQKAAKDAGSILGSRFSSDIKAAQGGLQDLGKRASDAGLDVSKLASLQQKASEAAAKLGLAQAQAASATEKANVVTNDASASAEKIALAQARAAVSAENVQKAELAAGDAMAMVQGEATRLADAIEASQVKSNLFTTVMGGMHERVGGLVSGFKNAIGGALEFGSKLGQTAFGIQALWQSFTGLTKALFSSDASMEQTQVAFTQLLGSSKAAGDYLKQLQAFASSTPFEFPELADDAQQMLAFGFSAQDVIPMLTDIGDAMGAMGKGKEQVAQIVTVFGQMHAAGKVNAQDMMQLTSTGVPAWKFLADAMGLSVAQVQKMTTEGLIPADKAISMIRAGMHDAFGGGMQAQSKTFAGILSTIQDNAMAGWRAFTGPLFEQAKGGLVQLGGLVSSKSFQDFAMVMGEKVGGAIKTVADFLSTQAIPAVQQFASFFKDNFAGLMPVIEDIVRQVAKLEFSQWKTELPIVKGILDALGSVLNSTVIPAIQQFSMGIDKMLQWLNSASLPAQITRDLLFGIGVAIATIQIGAFVATIPALVAGFGGWAVSAGLAAVATIAATWPILAIGAAIALVVGGIILAVQHWGDIMGWITGKTEETRIKVEQDHVKMRIAQDENTAQGAQAAINNYEKERQGILQKLKETHDPAEQAELQHQLKMTNAQEQGQVARLQKAEADKKKQLDKQKELHDQMVEAQKPWFQRMWDGISGFFGNVGKWFTDRFNDAKNGIASAFGNMGHWFGDRWHDIQNIWGGVGQWFHDRFEDAKNAIFSVFGGIGKWFQDRWNELPSPLKATLVYIGEVFQTIWNILVAIWGKLGAKFQEWWGDAEKVLAGFAIFIGTKMLEAWNAVVGAFQWLGKWFGDRWQDTKNILAPVGQVFHDLFTAGWNAVVGAFQFLGKWFGDRWQDAKNILAGVGGYIHDRFQEGWNHIVTIFSPLGKTFQGWWNDVMGGVNTLKTNISNKFNEVKTSVTNIFHDMINGIVDKLNSGISAVESFINFFGQGLDNIATALGTKGTIPLAHLPRIPHYAAGTSSHPGGPAIVGEEGREMVFMPPGAAVVPNDMTEMLLSMFGGKIPGYASGVGDIAGSIAGWISGGAKSLLDNVISALHISAPNLGAMSNIAGGIFDTVKNWALSWVSGILPKFNFGSQAVNVPGNVQSWIASAMALTGVPASWASPLAQIALHESGGNPAAINLTDSNAKAGHPSQGLFQTIPSTFAAHMLPGHTNILNPIDNAASAIEYIIGRYGDVFHVPGIVSMSHGGAYVGYANGGIINEPIVGKGLNTGTNYAFGERGKELVTPYVPSGVNLAQMAPTINVTNVINVQPNDFNIDGRRMNRALEPYRVEEIRRISGANI